MSIKYREPFLSSVIVRIDFLTDVSDFAYSLKADLRKAILQFFPIPEPKTISIRVLKKAGKEGEEQADALEPGSEVMERTEWHFFGRNREKELCLVPNAMFIEYKLYKDFETLENEFMSVLDALYASHPNIDVNRLGLRYINNIELSERGPTRWQPYVNRNMLCVFGIPEDSNVLARAFNVLELNYGDMNLRFQYGMHNPDFPAVIKKKIFTLDYDAYLRSSFTEEEIRQALPKFHEKIQWYFEQSITDRLRNKMGRANG